MWRAFSFFKVFIVFVVISLFNVHVVLGCQFSSIILQAAGTITTYDSNGTATTPSGVKYASAGVLASNAPVIIGGLSSRYEDAVYTLDTSSKNETNYQFSSHHLSHLIFLFTAYSWVFLSGSFTTPYIAAPSYTSHSFSSQNTIDAR